MAEAPSNQEGTYLTYLGTRRVGKVQQSQSFAHSARTRAAIASASSVMSMSTTEVPSPETSGRPATSSQGKGMGGGVKGR